MNPYGMPQPDFGSPLAPSMAPIPSVMDAASMPVKRGGMFGGNNIGMALSAALNGYLAAGGNRAGIEGLQALHQQRLYQQQQAAEDARAEANRAATLQNEMSLAQFKQKLDPTSGMGEFEKALFESGVQPGTPAWVQAMKTRTSNLLDPVVMFQGSPYLRSSLTGGGGQQAPAPGTIDGGYRFKGGNPADPSSWEPVSQGGPTPQASGGFPGPH
jgi:hypothetical protein